jgi:hypothetical protein
VTFFQCFKATYSASWAFVFACPMLALIPVISELLQHVVEVHLGFYDSVDAAVASERHPLRMLFGCLKLAALTLPGYWVVRFIANRDPSRAAKIETPAARLFAGFFAFMFILALFQLFGLPQTGAVQIAGFFVSIAITVLVAAWAVAAPLGNDRIGLVASAKIMARHLPWSFAFYIAAFLPLLVPHYALGALALVGPSQLLWPALILDSFLVGFIAPVVTATSYYIALRAAALGQVPLHPVGLA